MSKIQNSHKGRYKQYDISGIGGSITVNADNVALPASSNCSALRRSRTTGLSRSSEYTVSALDEHKPPRRFALCRLDADDILGRSSWVM